MSLLALLSREELSIPYTLDEYDQLRCTAVEGTTQKYKTKPHKTLNLI